MNNQTTQTGKKLTMEGSVKSVSMKNDGVELVIDSGVHLIVIDLDALATVRLIEDLGKHLTQSIVTRTQKQQVESHGQE